jgi:hypothetical protein
MVGVSGIVAVVRQQNEAHVLRFPHFDSITVLQIKKALAVLTKLPTSEQVGLAATPLPRPL